MLRYECEWCRRLKKPGERWILGFAAEYRGLRAMRVEFQLAAAWSERAAQEPFAVHFCSVDHQQKYAAAILGAAPRKRRSRADSAVVPPPIRGATVSGISRQRPDQRIFPPTSNASQSAIPSSCVKADTASTPTTSSPVRKRRTRRFSAADKAWARDIGISLDSPRPPEP